MSTISSKKTNAVRIVWTTSGSASRLQQIIERCKELGMIAIVELHDVTGSNSTSGLNDMANYFAGSAVKSILTSNEKYVLVNIANEWGITISRTLHGAMPIKQQFRRFEMRVSIIRLSLTARAGDKMLHL
ncbi:cellulase family glycosylhydrolase [Paenibacillus sp. LPE1-1-1.1]|uniref:cellulase family glycosylhydrolase n=1 Tax=Paenibacillus sp. LPE1-1-1.1 TaxID=3135230 RepID=UPI003431E70B